MIKFILFILFSTALCFGQEIRPKEKLQSWYFQKTKHEFHLHNDILISSNCLYTLSNCLAASSLKNAKNLELSGKYSDGGKNPLYMTCLVSNGVTRELKRNNERKKL